MNCNFTLCPVGFKVGFSGSGKPYPPGKPWALEAIGASHYHGNCVILSGISVISHSYLGTDHLPSLHVANDKQSLHLFIYFCEQDIY